MDVLFYGRLADIIGRELQLEVADTGCSIGDLRALIAARHPASHEDILSSRVRACVGDSIVSDDHLVKAPDSVEFFPPVSGG